NNRIRKVDAITGNISTIAGRDTAGYYGDGGLADSAGLNGPFAVLVNGNSNDIFISDEYDNRIRRIGIASGINAVSNNFDFNVYPNPANTGFTVETGNAFKGIIEIDNLQGQKVYQAPATANETHIDALQLANGLYFVYLKNSTGSSVQRVMVNH
ncbi:MAG TPA: T9SS type A sorting domain-containing protein, partial [Chitinophagales bacterium]|nr:T9SS type A sorting domain-containing protein [Chitinophagales bacterium]